MWVGLIFGALLTAHTFSAGMERQINDLGRDVIASHRTPGMAIGVVEDGRIVYARGFGFADRKHAVRFDPSTQTPVGAISMQFTAAAILLLEQDGKLKLGDPVTKYVPELTVAKGVTIRELLDHTSGLPDPTLDGDRTHTVKIDTLIPAADAMTPAAPPGTQYRANAFDGMIAGTIVARVSGVPLSDYIQQHIFIPLVMNESLLAGDTGLLADRASGDEKPWDSSWLYGGLGVITNVYDLAKWDIGLPLLLRVDQERSMFTASTAPGPQREGLGWTIDSRGGDPIFWQHGELPGFRTFNAVVPTAHVGVIVLANSGHLPAAAIGNAVLDIVLPPARANVDNAIVARAKEWLERIADKNIDRTQLTPAFSSYLNDELLAGSGFARLGKPLDFVPVSSTAMKDGGTVYEFLVRFPHEQYRYRFGVTKDGKIDEIFLAR